MLEETAAKIVARGAKWQRQQHRHLSFLLRRVVVVVSCWIEIAKIQYAASLAPAAVSDKDKSKLMCGSQRLTRLITFS